MPVSSEKEMYPKDSTLEISSVLLFPKTPSLPEPQQRTRLLVKSAQECHAPLQQRKFSQVIEKKKKKKKKSVC